MAKKERKETKAVPGQWRLGDYKWKANRFLDEYVEGLKEKKIIGSLCTGCGAVYVPPRYICGRCMMRIEERTQVSDKGTVICYVISPPVKKGTEVFGLGVDPVEEGWVEEGERVVTSRVQFDGATSSVRQVVENVDPEDMYPGMRVQAVWKEEREGKLSDLLGVEPIE